jgi:hypothetical protein
MTASRQLSLTDAEAPRFRRGGRPVNRASWGAEQVFEDLVVDLLELGLDAHPPVEDLHLIGAGRQAPPAARRSRLVVFS